LFPENESIPGGIAVCPLFFDATKTLGEGEETPPGANMKAVFECLSPTRAKSSVSALRKLIRLSCIALSRAILDICFAFLEAIQLMLFVREEISPPVFRGKHLGPFGRRGAISDTIVLNNRWSC